MATYGDLREWIDQAREIGELAVIEGADPKYEMGVMSELTAKNGGPAILHRKIKGYPPNFGVVTNLLSNIKTFNLIFGFPLANTIGQTVELMRDKLAEWEKQAPDYPPRVVERGPILENVVEGDAIDLSRFPVPIWHELDGGPYIGTADSWITRDPDTGTVNLGTYRAQLHDGRSVGMMAIHGQHGRLHRDKYFERGEACPAVLVVGADPLFFPISASCIPQHVSELNYMGAIRGEPVPVIMGRVTGLPIPANAEMAIEGFVDFRATKREGPFGEWQGYYAGSVTDQPFLAPSVLYHRNDAIICGSPPGKATYGDHSLLSSIMWSTLIYNEIAGRVPGVRGVWAPQAGGGRYLQVVSIKQQYGGHATHAGLAVASSPTGALCGRYTIVVDDDIDPYDLDDVMWAVSTRSLPTDIDVIQKSRGSHSEPMFRRQTTEPVDSTPPRAIIYAVKPYEWRQDFSKVSLSSEEVRRQVFGKWKGMLGERWRTI